MEQTLSVEDALSVFAQLALRANVAIEGDRLDVEFLGELGNRGVTALHGGLGETNLSLGEGELPAAPSPSGAGGFQSGDGALADQFALEFCQGAAKMPKTRRPAGVAVSIWAP